MSLPGDGIAPPPPPAGKRPRNGQIARGQARRRNAKMDRHQTKQVKRG